MGIPSVFPTGTTIYDPAKCWNGYTLMPMKKVGASADRHERQCGKGVEEFSGVPQQAAAGRLLYWAAWACVMRRLFLSGSD